MSEPTCPKCGSQLRDAGIRVRDHANPVNPGVIITADFYDCGSFWVHDAETWEHTIDCRIRELEAQVEQLTKDKEAARLAGWQAWADEQAKDAGYERAILHNGVAWFEKNENGKTHVLYMKI